MQINKEKCKKLLLGTVGIYFIYCVGSVIQQWIMKMPYENRNTHEQQFFTNSNAFILIPSICAWGIGSICNRISKPSQQTKIPIKNLAATAAIVLLTSLAMTRAIYLTNYPLVTLFKSCNLLSVLTVGIFCSRVKDKTQKLQKKNLISGFIITIGVMLYHVGSTTFKQSPIGKAEGVLLLLFSLVCDGFLPDFQAEIKTKYKPNAMQMFQQINKWKTILSLAYSIVSLQIKYVVVFYIQHPLSLVHMLALGLSGAVGQVVVYWMINNFKQHIVPFIITTRKLFTVVISIVFFKHQSTFVQVLGILVVFTTVLYDFVDQISIKSQIDSHSQQQPKIEQGYQKIPMVESSDELIRQADDITDKIENMLKEQLEQAQLKQKS